MSRFPILFSTAVVFASAQASWAGAIHTIAGTGAKGFSGDGGPALLAQFDEPSGMTEGPDGALYICDTGNQRIRKIAKDGTVTTVAGNGIAGWSGDGGPAIKASLHEPWEVRFDTKGNLFWVERLSDVVREMDAKTGIIHTVAGIGKAGFSGDGGPAVDAKLHEPHSLALDSDGNIFICDIHNNRIRRIDHATGVITTYSGTGEKKPTPEGAPIAGTPLAGPRAIAFDSTGRLWVVLRDGNKVVRFENNGTIHIVAGTGKAGFTGDGGPAISATLGGPKGIALAGDARVLIADTENHAIRAIDVTTGLIKRIAGTGIKGDGPDGDPLACQLTRPHGIFVARDGRILIGDTDGNRVRQIDP
jgi:streptogramin lyase